MEASGEPENSSVPRAQPDAQQGQANQQSGAYQETSKATFMLKCIWLFVMGAILALVGLITLLTRPDMGANPFIIMLMGLLFTAIGSIYGKRKLAGQAAVADYVVDPTQMLQIRPADVPPQPQQAYQQPQKPFQREPFDSSAFRQKTYEPSASSSPKPAIVQPQYTQPAASIAMESKPPASGIRKIFICPKCGAENEMDDKFCYRCGFKFTKPKKKADKAKKSDKKAAAAKAAAKAKPVKVKKAITKKQAKPARKPAQSQSV